MRTAPLSVICVFLGILAPLWIQAAPVPLQPDQIPDPLKSWSAWAQWNDKTGLESVPGTYFDPEKVTALWPSTLEVSAEHTGGRFGFALKAYARTWARLPGSREMWPAAVHLDDKEAVVVEHDGWPALLVSAGTHRITGEFRWKTLPRTLHIPSQTGLLSLVLHGQPVENATWDADGLLWLERRQPDSAGSPDFAELKVYRVLEDGTPMWLRTELELTVSGRNRELELGGLLPDGWSLASSGGPLPMAVDSSGRLKVQARAGKWTLHADAFRLLPSADFGFAQEVTPAASFEIIALKTAPDFRIIEVSGIPPIDVAQTHFPQKWRDLPVYRWDTKRPFQIVERIRGTGKPQPPGLAVTRQLWLDEDGRGLTFRDRITGVQQTLWRLDSVAGQQLGAVRNGNQGQLITKNPRTGETGVEVRSRTLQLDATGRITNGRSLPATGWNADTASAKVTLNLPPGWRLFALFGADYVWGDWLTAWTLLDLFVVLVFAMGSGRVFGKTTGVLALAALLLSYREPEAPRYTWLFLLAALALTRVVRGGWGARLAQGIKATAVVVLLLVLLPFLATQIQEGLHPQLEKASQEENRRDSLDPSFEPVGARDQAEPSDASGIKSLSKMQKISGSGSGSSGLSRGADARLSPNLSYDSGAKIQTGPPVPDWHWRKAGYGWNGPVSASQNVRLVLLPAGLVRILTALRIALLLCLCALLLDGRKWILRGRQGAAAALLLLGSLFPHAQATEPVGAAPITFGVFPDAQTLQLLRARLTPDSDAFPHAAEIPFASVEVQGDRLVLNADIHVAVRCAVPLPGKLPAWSPVRVLIDEVPKAALRREDGFLWTVLEAGVHRVRLEGLLSGALDWEWAFQLKPRRVEIRAPDWQVSGVNPNGVPEQQVFFRSKQPAQAVQGGYDRQEYRAALLVERRLEFGLNWQVRTCVRRLSPEGRAISLRVPLLAGEQVLTTGVTTAAGTVEVRLGAKEKSLEWTSELPVSNSVFLSSREGDSWVEQWSLAASPVWSLDMEGLPPVYTQQGSELVPQWNPWPGEEVRLKVVRAEAIPGATVTVGSVHAEATLGLRQRSQRLSLSIRSSLGEDFVLKLPPDSEVQSLSVDGKALPLQSDAGRLQVPLHPGEQVIAVEWQSRQPLSPLSMVAPVGLPVPSANVKTVLRVPDGRWVLWTFGPLIGPAVRLWSILLFSVLAGFLLGRLRFSPLGARDWVLLCIGLTQAPLWAALGVTGWLLCVAFRARQPYGGVRPWIYNLFQLGLVAWTFAALAILASAVAKGLLGQPESFLTGNGSSRLVLNWYLARSSEALPQPGCVHVSLWWYRLAMLLWALWLAGAVLRWLKVGWEAFTAGGAFRSRGSRTPPPLPGSVPSAVQEE